MRNRYLYALLITACIFFSDKLIAQCGVGYTNATLDWAFRDYLISSGNYSSAVSGTRAADQRFTIGTTAVRIQYSGTITNNGEGANNSADAGIDLDFDAVSSNGSTATITLTFDAEVANLRFSIYDIDTRQSVAINGKNALNIDVLSTLVKRTGGSSIITLSPATGIGTTVSASTGNSGVNTNNNDGTIDVTIAGPVKTVTLSLSNSGSVSSPDIYLSSISACVTGSFPTTYRSISRPFTGMPAYILTVVDNQVMLVDPATGKTKWLFTDPGWNNLNGMAYDPYKRILYYTYSLRSSAPGGNAGTKTIYKYDVEAETISTFVADVTASPLFLPTFESGVTSASASFYDGSYYFGVESSNSSRTSGRENIVWKIDFAADSLTPVRASQVYGTRVDSSVSGNNSLIHDWGDVGVTNGMLYDFTGAPVDSTYFHLNLMTGARTKYAPSGSGNFSPKQTAIDWQEQVYNMGGYPSSTSQNIGGFIVPYNYNGTVNSALERAIYTMPGPVYPTGSWGDCSEAFRPTCDFGDAPASYDPDPLSPAVHERDTTIRIGATWDREWSKLSSALANGDGSDEDGIAFSPIFSPGAGNYLTQVSVYNHTGENATVLAWLDFNGNGVFDASEVAQTFPSSTIASSTSMQSRYLYWPNAPTSLPNGSYTYLRVRIVKTSAGMTASNPTGYYDHGETEDYRITVDNYPLKVDLLSFDANLISDKNVKLSWKTANEENFFGFEIERSTDNVNWVKINSVFAKGNGLAEENTYTDNDLSPLKGRSFYRLKLLNADGKYRYSEVKTIQIRSGVQEIKLTPNPASDKVSIMITSFKRTDAIVYISDMNGRKLFSEKITVPQGNSGIQIPFIQKLTSGIYIVSLQTNEEEFKQKLIIQHN